MILDPSPDGRWMHGLSESPFYVKRDHAQPFGEMKVLTHFFHCLREKEQIEKKCNQTVKILNQKNNNRTEREKKLHSDNETSDRTLAILTGVQDFLAAHCTHPTLVCTLLTVDTRLHECLFAYSACLLVRLHFPAPQKTVFTPNATSTPEKPQKVEQTNKHRQTKL